MQETVDSAEGRHDLRWSVVPVLRSLTDMTDSGTDEEREEYLARLGMVLYIARRFAGFSQEQAAAEIGMSAAAIGRWEGGKNGISAFDLMRLIRLYHFDPDLAANPPASKVEIRKRLGDVPRSAAAAAKRGLLHPLPEGENGP